MKLPAQARDRLSAMLDQRVFMFKGGFKKEDVLAEIADILASSNSFSELLIEANQVSKKCGTCGKTNVVYRLTFRTVLIPALRILAQPGTLLRTPELVNACEDPNVGRMVGKYFAELRHWGLIDQITDGRYWATPLAHDFLAGRAAIPAWTWPKGETLPEECIDGPPRYVHELTDEHPNEDKARHMEEAVPNA